MNAINLKNFRCFHDEQTARLAPLTLLVGENSTGKTSFMAMIRALWDVAVHSRAPDFKEDPYDLGSFDEIAHHRGARGGRAGTFEAGFDATYRTGRGNASGDKPYHFEVTFRKRGTAPIPVRRHVAIGDTWADEQFSADGQYIAQVGTVRGSWETQVRDAPSIPFFDSKDMMPPPLHFMRTRQTDLTLMRTPQTDLTPLDGSPAFTTEDEDLLSEIARPWLWHGRRPPFASAPVRSRPRRTYDPSRPIQDPEGYFVPMRLADMYFQDKQGANREWVDLKDRLESFGEAAGLFNEISIKPLGKRESEPFQVQVRKRKSGSRLKGPWRNLIDVGYGVSQVLPVITELLRRDAPPLFLLQQPEVHLHPSAQAALGNLFCQVAVTDRQLVVETHSDHLLDRVRMDVRDGDSELRPDDVSILFFERGDLDVRIHSLRIDEEGNIQGAPDSYRSFFMQETQRSLRL